MDRDRLARWLNEQLHHIQKKASDIKPAFFPETIHEFRTDTKKLRAVLRLVAHTAGDEQQLPKSFKKLYRAAGTLRDLQVQLQFIGGDKRHSLPNFAVWLGKKSCEAMKRWNRRFSKPALKDLEGAIEGLRLPQIDTAALLLYCSSGLEKIGTLASGEPTDEALHTLRRQAKDLQHVLRFCRDEWPEGWELMQPLDTSLERLGTRAGSYNDRRNILDALDQFREDYKDQLEPEEQAGITRAWEFWSTAKAREREALVAASLRLATRKIAGHKVRPMIGAPIQAPNR